MKDPAFLFYASDFLTGCTNLTMEERGQYMTLLCIQHQTGHLSNKTISLSVGGVSDDLMTKFSIDDDGLFYNERLDIEIDKRMQFCETRRQNGSKGGRPKKPSAKPNGKPSAKPNGEAKKNLTVNRNVNIVIDSISKYFDEKYLKTDTSIKAINTLLKEYSNDDILNAVQWAKGDDFWTKQLLSPNKLNKKNKDDVKYIDVFLQNCKLGNSTSSICTKQLRKGNKWATIDKVKQYFGDDYTFNRNTQDGKYTTYVHCTDNQIYGLRNKEGERDNNGDYVKYKGKLVRCTLS